MGYKIGDHLAVQVGNICKEVEIISTDEDGIEVEITPPVEGITKLNLFSCEVLSSRHQILPNLPNFVYRSPS